MTTQTSPAQDFLPPPVALFQMATGHYLSQALNVAAKLGIADLIGQGTTAAEDLARATGVHAPSLRRVLRLLASVGVLTEEESGDFGLTDMGECMKTGAFRSVVLLFTGPLVWKSWGDLLYGVETGEMALEHAIGMDTFAYLAEHPDEGAIFDEAMSSFTSMVAAAVAATYDFSALRTLVDVGGGNGALLTGILRANPSLRGLLFDLPRVIEGARAKIGAAGLAERCAVTSGDFFEEVPQGGDAYMLKHVIHDWNDERALAILRNCRRVMPSHGKLLIVEGIYPPRIQCDQASRGAASNDVNMMVVTGGRQRSEQEFRELFDRAGFRLSRIVPTPAASCVIEGVCR